MHYSVDNELQLAFAGLSSDFNPLHVDPVEARRTMLGRQVVHGIHSCLRAIDTVAAAEPLPAFRKFSVRFIKPVFIGESVELTVKRGEADCVIECFVGTSRVAHITLAEPAESAPTVRDGEKPSLNAVPRVLTIDEAEGLEGSLSTVDREQDLREFFPSAYRAIGGQAIAVLLRLTRIVGMECPGHNSLFSSFALTLASDPSETDLRYRVAQVNRKVALVRIELSGAASGRIDAFFRPAIAADPASVPAYARPAPDEFKGRRALVIGGSRGLGRTTALLLAAGGADVVVTYRVGKAEADGLLEAVRAFGVYGEAIQFDVADPEGPLSELTERFEPTDLFYFVTPQIFVRKVQSFEVSLYRNFLEVYTMGFLKTVMACRSQHLSVFYPSSVAVEEPLAELAEYAAAKIAGEGLCDFLSMADDRLNILRRRLPRLPTDQTATLMDVDAADPFLTMLQICRDMRS